MTDLNYIRTMSMHETTEIKIHDDDIRRMLVTRVPGGWTYTYIGNHGGGASAMTTCFVPYNDKV